MAVGAASTWNHTNTDPAKPQVGRNFIYNREHNSSRLWIIRGINSVSVRGCRQTGRGVDLHRLVPGTVQHLQDDTHSVRVSASSRHHGNVTALPPDDTFGQKVQTIIIIIICSLLFNPTSALRLAVIR